MTGVIFPCAEWTTLVGKGGTCYSVSPIRTYSNSETNDCSHPTLRRSLVSRIWNPACFQLGTSGTHLNLTFADCFMLLTGVNINKKIKKLNKYHATRTDSVLGNELSDSLH